MRIPALALTILTAANVALAQPTYYARSVAGFASNGDGGPATAARVYLPSRVTTDAAGNVYAAEAVGRIRKIAVDSTISTIAPRMDGIASGDNGPASEAGISSLFGMTASGNFLYIAQRVPCNIRRVNLTTGIISNFAGNGTCAAGPDGLAASTSLNFPGALAADRQGRIYVTESAVVRRIDPATGRIEAFAGDGTPGFSGDESFANQARVNGPLGLAIDASGTVYISDTGNCRIRRVAASTGFITTIAGSSVCGSAGDGGTAIQAQLASNGELALDRTGSELYIASGSPTIRRIQFETGIIDRFAGTGVPGAVLDNVPSLQADLRTILSVHMDANGNLLFADYGGNRVAKIGANGIVKTVAGALTFAGDGGPAQFAFLSLPIDVIPESGGRLLIAESINRRIRRLSPPGVLSTVAGSGAPGGAAGNGGAALSASIAPSALFRDGSGNIYTTDALSNTVRRIGENGAITQVGPAFSSTLGGVVVDEAERFVYVSLTSQHRIVRISLATDQATVFAGAGGLADAGTAGFLDGLPATQALLNSPQRIFMDPAGNLFVADSGNNRIRRISASGDRIETVAGNGLDDFSGNGNVATQASLPSPTGVAVDSDGNIIANNDTSVFRVDKITGRMNRIAGRTVRGNTATLDGPALQASFNVINNVSVDARGVIYFAESLNPRVVALTPSTSNTPAVTGIIAPGNFGAGTTLTPGGWVEIYGEKLSPVTREWTGSDFAGTVAPTTFNGVRVRIGGINAFLQLISPGQINAVVPDGVTSGIVPVEVIIIRSAAETVISDSVAMVAAPRAPYVLAPPAFSRAGKQYVTAILADGAFVGPPGLIPGANFRIARSGNRAVIYGVGFGSVSPAVLAGSIATGLTALPNIKIKVAGQEAAVEYAGLATGFVGLYQLNFIVPSTPPGDAKLEITVDDQPITQTLYLAVE